MSPRSIDEYAILSLTNLSLSYIDFPEFVKIIDDCFMMLSIHLHNKSRSDLLSYFDNPPVLPNTLQNLFLNLLIEE